MLAGQAAVDGPQTDSVDFAKMILFSSFAQLAAKV